MEDARMKWIILAALILLTPGPALGQGACRERGEVLEHLYKKYKETPIAMGVTNRGGLIEVLQDKVSGTWTIIISTPQGTACLVASGEGWRTMEQVVLEPET